MSRNCHRLGDANDGGGIIQIIPQTTVYANDLLVAVDGSKGSGHPPGGIHDTHVWATANGSPSVFVQDIRVNRLADQDTCSHARIGGSPNVFIGP